MNSFDKNKKKKSGEEIEIMANLIYNATTEAIMLLSKEVDFVSCNPAAIKMFGCKDENDFLKYSLLDLSPEYQPDGVLSKDKMQEIKVKTVDKGSMSFEWLHKRLDGVKFFAAVVLTKVELENKIFFHAAARDITARKRSEEELEREKHDLEVFHRAAVDQEIRIVELKKEVNRLLKEKNEPVRYKDSEAIDLNNIYP